MWLRWPPFRRVSWPPFRRFFPGDSPQSRKDRRDDMILAYELAFTCLLSVLCVSAVNHPAKRSEMRRVSSLKYQVFSRRDAECAKRSQFVDGGFGDNCCLGKELGEEVFVGRAGKRSQLASFGISSVERGGSRPRISPASGFPLQAWHFQPRTRPFSLALVFLGEGGGAW